MARTGAARDRTSNHEAQRLRIERLLAKFEAALVCSARSRRYVFHPDEAAEAEAQGLPYVLVPRVCPSSWEWMERYAEQPAAEHETTQIHHPSRRHGQLSGTEPAYPLLTRAKDKGRLILINY